MLVTLLVTRLGNYLCKRTGNWRFKKKTESSKWSVCVIVIGFVCVSCKAALTEHNSNDNKTRIDNNNNNKNNKTVGSLLRTCSQFRV